MRTRRSQSSSNPVPSPAGSNPVGHRTVLLHETVESLDLKKSDVVVDGTLGGAGHALAIAGQLGNGGVLIGVDADKDAVSRARDVLAQPHATGGSARSATLDGSGPTVILINDNFRNIRNALEGSGVIGIDKAVFDLGWSSYQLSGGRGFSFLSDEPLSMAYSHDQSLTAEKIVNDWGVSSIEDVLRGFGEERYARRIAERIGRERETHRIKTAGELVQIIKAAVPAPYRYGRIHPATRSFQALRIAVNDELGALEQVLVDTWSLLRSKGRIAVITFHSLEDRIVKHRFAAWAREGEGTLITRKPTVPSEQELRENPRARSAKLRVIEKI